MADIPHVAEMYRFQASLAPLSYTDRPTEVTMARYTVLLYHDEAPSPFRRRPERSSDS